MEISTIFGLASGLGPAVTLIVLIMAIGVGIGVLIFTVKSLGRAITAQNKSFSSQVEASKKRSDERDGRIEELLAKQEIRITYIENRYASKEDLYKAVGGWRQEYLHLNQRIDQIKNGD
ncbi:MAG: hypothetical protein WC162_04525 [Sphaerochaetaceae bacterium]